MSDVFLCAKCGTGWSTASDIGEQCPNCENKRLRAELDAALKRAEEAERLLDEHRKSSAHYSHENVRRMLEERNAGRDAALIERDTALRDEHSAVERGNRLAREVDTLASQLAAAREALEGLVLVCAPGMPLLLDDALDAAKAELARSKAAEHLSICSIHVGGKCGCGALASPPPATVAPLAPKVHVLKFGRALCGFAGMPGQWPEGHTWIPEERVTLVTCADCAARVADDHRRAELEERPSWPKPGTQEARDMIYRVTGVVIPESKK